MFGFDDIFNRKELDIPIMEYVVLMSINARVCISVEEYPLIARSLSLPVQTIKMWVNNLLDRGYLYTDSDNTIWVSSYATELILPDKR